MTKLKLLDSLYARGVYQLTVDSYLSLILKRKSTNQSGGEILNYMLNSISYSGFVQS